MKQQKNPCKKINPAKVKQGFGKGKGKGKGKRK